MDMLFVEKMCHAVFYFGKFIGFFIVGNIKHELKLCLRI